MKHFPAHALRIPHLKAECEIISRVITDALKADYHISVYDGEEWVVKPTRDRAKIEAGCFATDYTAFRLREMEADGGTYRGFVDFIHGNGLEVIHDYSDNPEMEAILKSAQDWADSNQ